MSRLTSKPVLRLALLLAAVMILAALVYGLSVHIVGDPPERAITIVDGTAAAPAAIS
jgi:flagellar biosynthesis protein FliQ